MKMVILGKSMRADVNMSCGQPITHITYDYVESGDLPF